jgi:hypothetical protein
VTPRVVLVVEDGTEYVDAFRRLAAEGSEVELLHAPDAASARQILSGRRVDAIFLDVVFDRTPPEKLAGDRARGNDYLAQNQGFYVLADLAPLIASGVRVLLAHDFASHPARLAALQERVQGLEGVAESAGINQVMGRLLSRV